MHTNEGLVTSAYVVAAVLFILALGGLSNQEKAKRAIWYGIIGMTLAVGPLTATVMGAVKAGHTGVASGGMIPKLETAINAVESGVQAVVILDGRRPHAMLVELFTEFGAGTLVKAS